MAVLTGGENPVQEGDSEAEGLPGSGFRLTDDVVPAHCDREGHRLDGEGCRDARAIERFEDQGVDAVVLERGNLVRLHALRAFGCLGCGHKSLRFNGAVTPHIPGLDLPTCSDLARAASDRGH